MPFTSALLGDFFGGPGGFNETSQRLRQENQRSGEEQTAREQKILEHLSTSDDPEIRAAAVTGMLTKGDKGTGLDKWFGKTSSHPAFPIISGLVGQGHQPFLSSTEKVGAETEARYGGEISGTIKAAEKAGSPLSPDEIHRMTRDRFHATPRPFSTHPLNVKYYDENGEVQQTSVDYDPNEVGDARFQKYGQPFGYDIIAQSRGNFTEPNAYHNATNHVEEDKGQYPGEKSGTGWWRVSRDVNMKDLGHAGNAPAPPISSDFIGGPVQTSGGYSGMTKKGTLVPLKTAGGGPPAAPGVTPQTSADQLSAQMRLIQSAMQTEVPNFGMLGRNAPLVKASLDKHAVAAGFKDYADLEKQHGDAVRAVGARVQPPPVDEKAKKPAAAGGVDVNKVLDFLKKRPQ